MPSLPTDKKKKISIARNFFISFMACLVFLISIQSLNIYRKVKILRASPVYSEQRTVLQTQTDFYKVRLAINELRDGKPETLSALKKHFGIYSNHLEFLNTAEMFEPIRQQTKSNFLLLNLNEIRDKTAQILDQGMAKILSSKDELLNLFRKSDSIIQDLVIQSSTFFAESSDFERASLAVLLSFTGLFSITLVAILFAAIWHLTVQTTKLKRRELLLTESRQRLAATTRSALDAVIVMQEDGTIVDWNNAAVTFFGYAQEFAIGKNMSELIIPERFREAHKNGMKKYLETGETNVIGKRIEIDALYSDGSEFPVELAINVAKDLDQKIFIAYLRDISQRKLAETELKKALALAKEANEAKANFLAIMSHEMRTPLNGVIGALDLLGRTKLSKHQTDLVDTAEQSGEALLAQISDVLDFSRMEAGKLELDLAPFDVRKLLTSIENILRTKITESFNVFEIISDPLLSNILIGDAKRLRQVLLNFASNAAKFTTQGKIVLKAGPVDDAKLGRAIEFSIADTGIGISPESILLLFKEFSMVDSSYHRQSEGTGLGLAISKRIVEAMKGTVGVESELGKGSRFWFRIVLEEGHTVIADKPLEHEKVNVASTSLRILLVEDNITNQMVARQMLGNLNHNITIANDGKQAVEHARKTQFDLILMDISMPVMDGLEATRIIRSTGGMSAKTPIVAMTANAVAGDREKFLDAGMNDYVTKPIRQATLQACIDKFTAQSAAPVEK